MFLLDTNVISELRKIYAHKADPNVTRWSERTPTGEMFLSVITIFELEMGIRRLERRDRSQANMFRNWLEGYLLNAFDGRIFPATIEIARVCAAYHVPDPAPFRDSFIAATAQVHNLILVTRNTSDFVRCGIPLLNPWQQH